MKIKEYEYCLRCGRKLKNPISRQTGYGVVCTKKLKMSLSNRPLIYTKLSATMPSEK